MTAYYNEIDPFAAEWLRNLVAAGVISPGDVDERDIRDVRPSDLVGYTQCHFFAGIGVWSYAARLAGWPDERPLWTGSCPCQPFSAAGKGGGFNDERHLWPDWHYLIRECGPSVVFGEQVASKDGYAWLDLVQSDMEGVGYALGPHVSPSAGFGAPHERHRIRFAAVGLADRTGEGWQPRGRLSEPSNGRGQAWLQSRRLRDVSLLDHHHHQGLERHTWNGSGALGWAEPYRPIAEAGLSSELAHSVTSRPGPTNGFWRDADWLFCRDDKWRPVEPSTFPLAHGASSRMGRLRAYGNAVDAQATAHFISCFLEAERDGFMDVGARNIDLLDELL